MFSSTEKEIATVQAAGPEDVDDAVKAAKKALKEPSWKLLSASDRGQLMSKLADLLESNKEILATIDAWDNGKSYMEALNTDLTEAISTIRYYAGWADKIHGQTISTTHQKLAYTLRQPIGVVSQIIPWNYPLSMVSFVLVSSIQILTLAGNLETRSRSRMWQYGSHQSRRTNSFEYPGLGQSYQGSWLPTWSGQRSQRLWR